MWYVSFRAYLSKHVSSLFSTYSLLGLDYTGLWNVGEEDPDASHSLVSVVSVLGDLSGATASGPVVAQVVWGPPPSCCDLWIIRRKKPESLWGCGVSLLHGSGAQKAVEMSGGGDVLAYLSGADIPDECEEL